MKLLSQRDNKWVNNRIGESPITVGGFGCLITSLSMFSDWYGKYRDPAWMAKNLKFTKDGLFLWPSMNDSELPFKFVYRYYKRDDKKIKEILNSKDNACVLQVNNGKHWVALVGYSRIYGYKIADPFYGDIIYINKHYPNITGFAEITRK
jgi:hypothetical protein